MQTAQGQAAVEMAPVDKLASQEAEAGRGIQFRAVADRVGPAATAVQAAAAREVSQQASCGLGHPQWHPP